MLPSRPVLHSQGHLAMRNSSRQGLKTNKLTKNLGIITWRQEGKGNCLSSVSHLLFLFLIRQRFPPLPSISNGVGGVIQLKTVLDYLAPRNSCWGNQIPRLTVRTFAGGW